MLLFYKLKYKGKLYSDVWESFHIYLMPILIKFYLSCDNSVTFLCLHLEKMYTI